VPPADRVKISSTNLGLETTMFLKSLCISFGTQSRRSKAQILMNSFWPTRSAESMLKSFRKILDIYLRVKGEEFTELQNVDDILTFPVDHGYHKYTNIKKTADDSLETVDVSEESEPEPEPEPIKRKISSRRVVKKKVTFFAADNIIFDDLDAALELGKSISLTKAKEAEAARKVHATHARIVTESVPES
ncbi:hypothetical protein Tco_1560671, partial [Tanacetum coccineum]